MRKCRRRSIAYSRRLSQISSLSMGNKTAGRGGLGAENTKIFEYEAGDLVTNLDGTCQVLPIDQVICKRHPKMNHWQMMLRN